VGKNIYLFQLLCGKYYCYIKKTSKSQSVKTAICLYVKKVIMKILGIASQKGGVGKSTITIHLAVLAAQKGLNVVVADTDPQSSVYGWSRLRNSDAPTVVELNTKQLSELIGDAKQNGFDLMIIDSAPSHSSDVVDICSLADFTLIPSRPSVLDLNAIGATVGLMTGIKAKASILLNSCPPGRSGESSVTKEARQALAGAVIPVADVSITTRAAFSHSLNDGRGISEFEPKSKATKEISALWHWVNDKLKG
jgi:chromosome partitioning protein